MHATGRTGTQGMSDTAAHGSVQHKATRTLAYNTDNTHTCRDLNFFLSSFRLLLNSRSCHPGISLRAKVVEEVKGPAAGASSPPACRSNKSPAPAHTQQHGVGVGGVGEGWVHDGNYTCRHCPSWTTGTRGGLGRIPDSVANIPRHNHGSLTQP